MFDDICNIMINKGKKDKIKSISGLIAEFYGNIEIANSKFLEHEYFNNPSGDAIIGIVENDNNEIIAQQSVWKMRINFFNKEIICCNSLNSLVKEEHWGQGIFSKLADKVFEWAAAETEFCYAMPNPNSYYSFKNKLGFREIGEIPLYIKIINPSQLVEQKMNSKFWGTLVKPLNIFFTPKKLKISDEIELETITSENLKLVDELWNKIKGKYHIMNKKDSEYIKFRYIEIPIRQYEVKVVKEYGKVKALIVGRVMNVSGISCGMIVDFLCDRDCKNVGKYSLKYMEHFFFEKNVSLIGCLMLQHTEEKEILKKNMMFRCPKLLEPQPFPLLVKSFNKDGIEELYDIKNWFFTMGDYDAI